MSKSFKDQLVFSPELIRMIRGVSDHIPVMCSISLAKGVEINIITWNLLSDQYLHYLMCLLPEYQEIKAQLLGSEFCFSVYQSSHQDLRLYAFLYDFGVFVFEHYIRQNEPTSMIIDQKLIKAFVHQSSSCLSNNKKALIQDRQNIFNLMKNKEHGLQKTFKMILFHSIELAYHILSDQGVLKFSNRMKHLASAHPELLKRMRQMSFLCFQECTDPQRLLSLFPDHRFIYHQKENKADYVVIGYHTSYFGLLEDPVCGNLEFENHSIKPWIFARFKHLLGYDLQVGSVHHPGVGHSLVDQWLTAPQAKHLYQPCIFAGDFNHTESWLTTHANIPQSFHWGLPQTPTFTGYDYNNHDLSIDGFLTNTPLKTIESLGALLNVVDLPSQFELINMKGEMSLQWKPKE
ncbi:MAG: hypothetical protein CMF42_05520 [Legionellales bacterium]|nr:hypothetical protein [Legionellales bacterium]OUX66870.1 MAG: hypothetical protein CBD38_03865 [bacterium TMED178]